MKTEDMRSMSFEVLLLEARIEHKLTAHLTNLQHIANDGVGDFGCGLAPGDVKSHVGHSTRPETLGGDREVLHAGHSQPRTGLVGARAVLCDALIDGLVLERDASHSQGAGGEKNADDLTTIRPNISRRNTSLQPYNPLPLTLNQYSDNRR